MLGSCALGLNISNLPMFRKNCKSAAIASVTGKLKSTPCKVALRITAEPIVTNSYQPTISKAYRVS